MAKTQYVTIPLDEYKELLLKERPTDRDHEILNRIIDAITAQIKYSEKNRWSNNYIGDNMGVEYDNAVAVVKEIMNILKYTDFDRYMVIWNGVQTAERNRKAMQDQIDHMNAARELRNEHDQ